MGGTYLASLCILSHTISMCSFVYIRPETRATLHKLFSAPHIYASLFSHCTKGVLNVPNETNKKSSPFNLALDFKKFRSFFLRQENHLFPKYFFRIWKNIQNERDDYRFWKIFQNV